MAIPVITDHFQAQWAWLGPSGLPEDVYITTWYFRNDSVGADPATVGATIETVLEAFWLNTNGTALDSVNAWMPNTLNGVTIKVYDLGESLPRYPVYENTNPSLSGAALQQGLPREVALVNSYYAGRGPRLRGRNYIGPLAQNALDTDGADNPAPDENLRIAITQSALNVLNTAENVTWVQVSPTAGAANPVTGGWCDNAFDTQRRRGVAPSQRLTWGAPA